MRANLRDLAAVAGDDPRKTLLAAIGPMTDYEMFHNMVLVATYIPPEKTKGGIIITDRSLAENRYQGKIGMVIKKGPLAFQDDATVKFGGIDIEIGDWVLYRPSDGIEMFIRDCRGSAISYDGVPCRMLEDAMIKGRVRDPSLIY